MTNPTEDPTQRSMSEFMKKKRGRPKRRATLASATVLPTRAKRGRPTTEREAAKKSRQKAKQNTVPSPPLPNTNKRVNHSNDENFIRAVNEWLAKTGRAVDSNGDSINIKDFCSTVGVPYNTFRHYVCKDVTKRRKLGSQVGKPPLLDKNEQQFIAQVLARKDRANDGASATEAIDLVQELNPKINRVAASRHLARTLAPKNPEIKIKPRVAQATTTKRSNINVQQQFRWHTLVDTALDELRTRNVGRCNLSGKTFGELIHYFVVGGDETCLMATENGSIKVYGSANRTKHEKINMDSRASVTMYRTGTPAGDTGPTIFLCAGSSRRGGYSDKFLMKGGASKGSTIIMTENAFMTDDAWEAMTPNVIDGLRSINDYVKANPQWWMLEIFDGFGSHIRSYTAMQARFERKILCIKEEGDSSHCNQAYDKYVAAQDKSAKTQAVGMIQACRGYSKGITDQWGLVHVGLFCVRSVQGKIWTRSFEACNLDPRSRVPFKEWCIRIQDMLQVGECFKNEDQDVDVYLLLPRWWHAMEPDDKKKAMAIYDQHKSWTVRCCQELQEKCVIPKMELQNLRVCIECALKDPSHLDRELPTKEELEAKLINPEVTHVSDQIKGASEGLKYFQLHPKELADKHEEHFAHLITKRHLSTGNVKPSAYLDVEQSEWNTEVLMSANTEKMQTKRSIMKDAFGERARMKIAQRKVNAMGLVQSHCAFINNEVELAKMKNQHELAASIAEIEKHEQMAKAEKKAKEERDLNTFGPQALKKLVSCKMDATKLTKNEIRAIAHVYFNETIDKKLLKVPMLKAFAKLQESSPNMLAVSVAGLGDDVPTLAAAKPVPVAAAAAEKLDETQDEAFLELGLEEPRFM